MPEDTKKKTDLNVILSLATVPLLMVLGNSMLIPALPQIRSALDVSQFQVSLLITLFSVPAGIIIPIAGILSDRIGRKKVIIPSLILYGAGGILAGFSPFIGGGSYAILLTGRIIQGVGAAGTTPIAMALVSDLYTKTERSKALGIIEASNGMGKVLSPILGSLIALITWYALFFAFPIFIIPAVIALWIVVKEPDKEQEKKQSLSQYKEQLIKIWKRQGKWLSVAFLAGAVTLFTLFGVLFYLSEILEKTYHIDGVKKGLILAIPLLASSSTSYIIGSYVQRRARKMKGLITAGLFIIALPIGLVSFITNNIILLSLLVFIGIGAGLVLPCLNTMITSSVGKEERGMVTSFYNSVRFLGVAVGPPVFGALMDSKMVLFLGIAGLATLSGMLTIWIIPKPDRLRGIGGQSRILLRRRGLRTT